MDNEKKLRLALELEEEINGTLPSEKEEIADVLKNLGNKKIEIESWINQKTKEFDSIVSTSPPEPFELNGKWFRAINRIYDQDPLTTEGSKYREGRFHLINEESTYLAEDSTTCNYEVGIDKNFVTYSFWAIEFNLSGLVDLRSEELCKMLGIEYKLLRGNWETLNLFSINSYSQLVSRKLRNMGFEGIVYKSTKDKNADCVVIFKDNLKKSSYLEIVDQRPELNLKKTKYEGTI